MSETVNPKAFELSDTRDISPALIQGIRESVGWDGDTPEVWEETLRSALEVASAWDSDKLIGVGFLIGSPRHAVLCDIAVSPDWQQEGIGREIAQQLLDVANEKEIKYVTLTFDDQKPWLADFYASLGFAGTDNAMQLQRPPQH